MSVGRNFFTAVRVNALSGYSIDRYVPTANPRIIAFRFIPNSVVSKPVAAVWGPAVADPWNGLPRMVRYGIGWLALLAIVFGSAFGFSLPQVGPTCL